MSRTYVLAFTLLSSIPVRETQSATHPRAQRNAFPSLQCASAIQIVRPRESKADAAPAPTGFLEIVSDYFPVLHSQFSRLVTDPWAWPTPYSIPVVSTSAPGEFFRNSA